MRCRADISKIRCSSVFAKDSGLFGATNMPPPYFSISGIPPTRVNTARRRRLLGFQGKAQLEVIYGHLAEVMLSQPATKIFLKTTEPKAAERVSNAIGKVEIERMKKTHFDGSRSGRNFSVDRQVEPLVMDSEISGLENRHAFLKLGNNVARFHFEYMDLPLTTPGFIPRRDDEDELSFDPKTLAPRNSGIPSSTGNCVIIWPTTSRCS